LRFGISVRSRKLRRQADSGTYVTGDAGGNGKATSSFPSRYDNTRHQLRQAIDSITRLGVLGEG